MTMNEDQRIYLASPYSSPEQAVRDYRHRLAWQFTSAHLKRGRAIFSPIVNGVALTETGSRLWGFVHWQDYDLSFLQHWATELWVLCLDGWKDSVGVRKEIREAESLGLPVKYIGVLEERLKIEQWPVERLRPYGRELKVTDKALPQMVDALRQWGFRIPLLVTGDGEIVDGKTRYRAALELRMETVPVIVADDLTPTQVRTFRLLVNRSATWADWNDEALRAEMAELRLELDDLRLTRFCRPKELDIFLQGAVADSEKDPDDAPPVPETPTCKLGDVWQLGIHRLMCGDSTKAADVVTLMSGEQADMVWTDPPYNVDYSSKAGKIKNDKMSPGAVRRLPASAADLRRGRARGRRGHLRCPQRGRRRHGLPLRLPGRWVQAGLLPDLAQESAGHGPRRLSLATRAHLVRLEADRKAPLVRQSQADVAVRSTTPGP